MSTPPGSYRKQLNKALKNLTDNECNGLLLHVLSTFDAPQGYENVLRRMRQVIRSINEGQSNHWNSEKDDIEAWLHKRIEEKFSGVGKYNQTLNQNDLEKALLDKLILDKKIKNELKNATQIKEFYCRKFADDIRIPLIIREEFEKLTDKHWDKLNKYAVYRAGRFLDWDSAKEVGREAVQMAVDKALSNVRNWNPQNVDFIGFMKGSIKSIISHWNGDIPEMDDNAFSMLIKKASLDVDLQKEIREFIAEINLEITLTQFITKKFPDLITLYHQASNHQDVHLELNKLILDPSLDLGILKNVDLVYKLASKDDHQKIEELYDWLDFIRQKDKLLCFLFISPKFAEAISKNLESLANTLQINKEEIKQAVKKLKIKLRAFHLDVVYNGQEEDLPIENEFLDLSEIDDDLRFMIKTLILGYCTDTTLAELIRDQYPSLIPLCVLNDKSLEEELQKNVINPTIDLIPLESAALSGGLDQKKVQNLITKLTKQLEKIIELERIVNYYLLDPLCEPRFVSEELDIPVENIYRAKEKLKEKLKSLNDSLSLKVFLKNVTQTNELLLKLKWLEVPQDEPHSCLMLNHMDFSIGSDPFESVNLVWEESSWPSTTNCALLTITNSQIDQKWKRAWGWNPERNCVHLCFYSQRNRGIDAQKEHLSAWLTCLNASKKTTRNAAKKNWHLKEFPPRDKKAQEES